MGGIVSGVGHLLGGGSNGSGFQAQSANVVSPIDALQAQEAVYKANAGINQQHTLANALAAQNGIGNQSSVFNQLQGVGNGTGPNPALAQLNNTTGQNIANQAALMAGQRGAGANTGLIARQAAQQGGALEQQAAGQGAALQANQSLNALGQLGGIAGQQVAQQQGALNSYNQAAQGSQQALLGQINSQNNANVANAAGMNSANANVAKTNAEQSGGFLGGALNGLGGAALTAFSGGAAPGLVAAGQGAGADLNNLAGTSGNGYSFGSSYGGNGGGMLYSKGGEVENPKVAEVPMKDRFSGALEPHIAHMAQIYHPDFSKGGKVNALVSPGEVYLPPEKAKAVANGKANPLKEGDKVPGKAAVKGDSKKNDVVPAKLEEGGVVVPRSVLQSKDPAAAAAKFVAAHIKKHGSGDEEGDFKSALKRAISNRKSK